MGADHWKEKRKPSLTKVREGYEQGKGAKAIGREIGQSWGFVNSCLRDMGLPVRDRKEARRERDRRSTPEQRAALTARAHEALRGKPRPQEWGERLAVSKAASLSAIGELEQEIGAALRALGVNLSPQVAVGPYNLDLARWPFALEVHRQEASPKRNMKKIARVRHLTAVGWSVAYFWITPGKPVTEPALLVLASLFRETCQFFPGKTKAWIVRHDGSIYDWGI